eukprot:COSAG01_NODE_1483_length_10158_cov_38.218290_11_plen_267_part_00
MNALKTHVSGRGALAKVRNTLIQRYLLAPVDGMPAASSPSRAEEAAAAAAAAPPRGRSGGLFEYVLWMDADVTQYPPDLVARLHAANPGGVSGASRRAGQPMHPNLNRMRACGLRFSCAMTVLVKELRGCNGLWPSAHGADRGFGHGRVAPHGLPEAPAAAPAAARAAGSAETAGLTGGAGGARGRRRRRRRPAAAAALPSGEGGWESTSAAVPLGVGDTATGGATGSWPGGGALCAIGRQRSVGGCGDAMNSYEWLLIAMNGYGH